MIRKYWALHCDVKGCQNATTPTLRGKAKLKDLGEALGWELYQDFRKKDRARCPRHAKLDNPYSSCHT